MIWQWLQSSTKVALWWIIVIIFIPFNRTSFNQQLLFQQLAAHMPARTQGYPWQLVYSTAIHGSSLKTLYRNMAGLDSPVLLVIKDMHKKVCIFNTTLQAFEKHRSSHPNTLINSIAVGSSLMTWCIGLLRCLGLFLLIHSKSVNTATAQEKPSCSASTLSSR